MPQRAGQPAPIPHDPAHALRPAQVQGQAAILQPRRAIFDQLGQQREQVHFLTRKGQHSGFALRQVQHRFDLLAQPLDRREDRGDIFAALLGQLAAQPGFQQFGKPADRGQRRTEFIAHVGKEARFHRVRFFQRGVAFAQGFLSLLRIGDVQHGQQPVAIGQRHAREFQRAPIGQHRAPRGLPPVQRRAAHGIAHGLGLDRFEQPARDPFQQRLDPGMGIQERVFQSPVGCKPPVPQLHPAIGREHRDRFEQAVERGGAGAQQGIADGGQAQLLGPVLRNQHQPAIGQRLRDDPQVRAVTQRPGFLLRRTGQEPARALSPPGREIARFGHPARIARLIQEPFELRRIDHHGGLERENALERLVGKGQLALCIELGDPGGQLVQHGALRLAERAEGAALLFHVLDIDGVTGHAFIAQRQVRHAQRPARAVDRRRDDPLDRQALGCRLQGNLPRGQAIDAFDQFRPVRHHGAGILAPDRTDIGIVDQPQRAVAPAEPHRHRCRFDQADQRGEIGTRTGRFGAQLHQFALAVGKVEHPHQRRAAGRHRRVGQVPAQGQAALRPARGDHHAERCGGFLGAAHRLGQLRQLLAGQPAAAAVDPPAVQLGQKAGDRIQPQPVGQPLRRLDLAVDAHQQRQRRTFIHHPRQPLGMALAGFGAAFALAGRQHRPRRSHRPRGQQQPDHGQSQGGQGHDTQLCAPSANGKANGKGGTVAALVISCRFRRSGTGQ